MKSSSHARKWSAYLSPQNDERLKTVVNQNGVTRSETINTIVTDYFRRNPPPEKKTPEVKK